MPTSSDGVLTAEFDPDRNLVSLYVDGESWTGESPPSQVSITRSSPGVSSIPVRGAERLLAPGGTALWSDNEAPMATDVTYTVIGYSGPVLVGASSVIVSTRGAAWGAWVKVPGRPELTVLATVKSVGDMSRQTMGGYWQIPGGPTLSQSGGGASAQSAGMGALSATLTLSTRDPGLLGALDRAVRSAPGQVLLIQTGQPEELPSGYYFAESITQSNPLNMSSDDQPLRHVSLPLVESAIPAGPSTGWTGVTYQDVFEEFATYQALADTGATYLDVAQGTW